jgi:hypothetical protein
MGFLGFLAVTDGALLTVAGGLEDSRWTLLIGASGAIVIILVGLLWVGRMKSGPNAVEFYTDYREASLATFLVQMLSDLGKSVFVNDRSIERREALFLIAVSWAAVFAIWFGLIRAHL